ncbi:MAG: polyprenyl diphosphate synthase [Pseudomonadota bacterium]
MQSNLYGKLHVALIMDGNGRWAKRRGLPRTAGHRAGADTVRRIIRAAPDLDVGMLTFYAFSSDNWKRPAAEIDTLMDLLRRYLRTELAAFVENGVRFVAIGRRDRLPPDLVMQIRHVEAETAKGHALTVRIALDYSSRDALIGALAALPRPSHSAVSRHLSGIGEACDVDLLIRTSGEQRLSDFLLWECAYAEFCFTKKCWPDFGAADLKAALVDFATRSRRFGGLDPSQSGLGAEAVG